VDWHGDEKEVFLWIKKLIPKRHLPTKMSTEWSFFFSTRLSFSVSHITINKLHFQKSLWKWFTLKIKKGEFTISLEAFDIMLFKKLCSPKFCFSLPNQKAFSTTGLFKTRKPCFSKNFTKQDFDSKYFMPCFQRMRFFLLNVFHFEKI